MVPNSSRGVQSGWQLELSGSDASCDSLIVHVLLESLSVPLAVSVGLPRLGPLAAWL